MLVVSYRHNREIETVTWHVDERVPGVPVSSVLEVQADGDELEHIEKVFSSSIPMPKVPVAKWYGDIARTIYLNIGNFHHEL